MSRKKLVSICLASVVVFAVATALAAAVKVELMPYPEDEPLEPGASGHAMLNHAEGSDKTIVQVNCMGLKPEATYTVLLKGPEDYHAIGTFETRKNGTGNLNVHLDGDHCGHLPVAVNNQDNQTVLLSK
jgi:hypothetical protein